MGRDEPGRDPPPADAQARPGGFELFSRPQRQQGPRLRSRYTISFLWPPNKGRAQEAVRHVAADLSSLASIQLIGFCIRDRVLPFPRTAAIAFFTAATCDSARLRVVLPPPISCALCACASRAHGNNQNQIPAAGRRLTLRSCVRTE
jgi:hypothetical protein